MKRLVLIGLVALSFTACGKGGGSAGGPNEFKDGAEVIAALEARAKRMCECPDAKCALAIESEPKDPLGQKAQPHIDKMSDADKAKVRELKQKNVDCNPAIRLKK